MQQDNNFLLQQSVSDFSYQLRLKLKYLQQQKDKLQLTSNQMIQNINLLRNINKQLSKSANINPTTNKMLQKQPSQKPSPYILLQHLQSQNTLLQQSYLRILASHNSIQCQNLMLNQIIQQSSQQYRNILKQYQSKIIQLRRSIQFKQSCIQTYQMNKQIITNVNSVEMGNIAPSNVSILFFNQIDGYKQDIQLLEKNNKKLQKMLKIKNDKLEKVQKQKQSIERLILTSNGYYQFKHLIKEQIINGKSRIKSLPKSDIIKSLLQVNTNIINQLPIEPKNKKSSDKKINMGSTQLTQSTQLTTFNSSSQNINSPKLIQLKQQLKKKTVQYTKLGNLYHKQKTKRKQLEQKIKIIINSNKFYKQKRQQNYNQLKYYKKTTLDLIKIIQKRKITSKKSYSTQKNIFQSIVLEVKNKNIQLSPQQENKKVLFRQFKKDLDTLMKKNKVVVRLDNKQKYKLKRSYSDILGYTELSHQDDKVEMYYYKQKSPKKSQNNHKNIKNRQTQITNKQSQNQNDFSHLLSLGPNGQIFNDQSLLIKPSKVMSYAQRRKIKSNNNYNNFDAHNLTIIRENVL